MTGARLESNVPRGRPLLMLLALLGGWIAMRAVLWQSPFPPLVHFPVFAATPRGSAAAGVSANRHSERLPNLVSRKSVGPPVVPGSLDAPNAGALPPPWLLPGAEAQAVSFPFAELAPFPEHHIVGQQLLLAAAFSRMELPPEIAAYFAAQEPVKQADATLSSRTRRAGGLAPLAASAKRWSADGWLLLRRDSSGALAAGEPSYGRSQAGAVLRYQLAPSSRHRPVAYGRVTGAIAGPREAELAIGLAARPLAGVPVTVAVEGRAYDGAVHRELRPAAYAVTELPPAKLPLGLRGEAYAQAGYVGGRFATGFVDGQARVDEKVARLGPSSELRVGAGVWGGAQKHTARLDVGPSATVSFRLGPTQSRLAVDYRWRVAGNAQPKRGPALTISAGF